MVVSNPLALSISRLPWILRAATWFAYVCNGAFSAIVAVGVLWRWVVGDAILGDWLVALVVMVLVGLPAAFVAGVGLLRFSCWQPLLMLGTVSVLPAMGGFVLLTEGLPRAH